MSAAFHPPSKFNNPPGQAVRVMIVDDSSVARSIISRILGRSKDIGVILEATGASDALNMLREQKVDIILLDIEMPKRSGLDALPELLDQSAGANILVVSSFAEENGPAAIKALTLGASDTLSKPGRSGFSGNFSEALLEKVVFLAQSKRNSAQLLDRLKPYPSQPTLDRPNCVAIGSSTGGIPAIFEIIAALDPQFDCPILITQHLPAAFMPFFARQLERLTSRSVSIAQNNMRIEKHHIYIAPGHSHLACRRVGSGVRIETLEEYNGSQYRPSVDAMLYSVAAAYGAKSMGIILSGMGQDGLIGARKIAEKNGNLIAQDAASSVVWGMPGAIVRENMAAAVLSPTDIAKLLNDMAGHQPHG